MHYVRLLSCILLDVHLFMYFVSRIIDARAAYQSNR
jgi:hypothetical protein